MKNKLNLISNFNDRFIEAFGERGVTEFAEEIGLSKQTISAYLNKARKPKRPTVEVLAERLDVSPLWLLGYDVPMERRNIFVERLTEAIKNKGITKYQFADSINLSPPVFARILTGIKNPSENLIIRMAAELDVSVPWLKGYDDALDDLNYLDIETPEEKNKRLLLEAFQSLNEEGQLKVIDYADDLVNSGRYKKSDKNELALKKEA